MNYDLHKAIELKTGVIVVGKTEAELSKGMTEILKGIDPRYRLSIFEEVPEIKIRDVQDVLSTRNCSSYTSVQAIQGGLKTAIDCVIVPRLADKTYIDAVIKSVTNKESAVIAGVLANGIDEAIEKIKVMLDNEEEYRINIPYLYSIEEDKLYRFKM